ADYPSDALLETPGDAGSQRISLRLTVQPTDDGSSTIAKADDDHARTTTRRADDVGAGSVPRIAPGRVRGSGGRRDDRRRQRTVRADRRATPRGDPGSSAAVPMVGRR